MKSLSSLFRSHGEIYHDANEGRQFDFLYAAMLVFGCLISLFGLLLNSPAVIIGAMLISPLMGPLLACGLSLSLADWHIGTKSARNLLFSILETIFIAALATWVSPLRDITPEIAARTNPNLIDLLIALLSGTAGTLALCSKRQAFTIVPGVAIATAVMPPLATIGFGLTTRQFEVARGASLLFVTNMTAIILSAALVFTFVGFRPREHLSDAPHRLLRLRLPLVALVLCVLAVPLFQTLRQAALQTSLRKRAREEFDALVGKEIHSKPSYLSVDVKNRAVTIHAVVPTDEYLSSTKVQKIESRLSTALSRPVQLHVEQVQLATAPAAAGSNKDYVAGGAIKPQEVAPDPAQQAEQLRNSIRQQLCDILAAGGATSCDVDSIAFDNNQAAIAVTLNASEPLAANTLKVTAHSLSSSLSMPVQLSSTVHLNEHTAKLELQPKSTRLSKSSRDELQKLTPLLQDSTLHVELEIPSNWNSKQRNGLQQAVAKELHVDTERVLTRTGDSEGITAMPVQLLTTAPPEPKDTTPSAT